MMVRYLALTLFFLTWNLTAQGQAPQRSLATVTGEVVEEDTREALPSATVAIYSAEDSSLVTGAITDADGRFSLENIRPGSYRLRVSFVGYQPVERADLQITPRSGTVEVGTLAMAPSEAALGEVEVRGERAGMQVQADKTIYNVQAQPVSAGGSGRTVLENIPSVEVDIDGAISLRGSADVAIYLNGKPAPMQGEALTSFLEGLSAEAIERVEVIPNPSARYDPEGLSGIINIVLARDRPGTFGGSVSASAETTGEVGGSTNLHFNDGPWSIYGNYSLRRSVRESSGESFREIFAADQAFEERLYQDSFGDRSGLSNTLNTTVEYAFSKQRSLSVSGLASYRGRDSEERNEYTEAYPDQGDWLYERLADGDRTDWNLDGSITYRNVIRPSEHEWSIEANYEREWESSDENYLEQAIATTALIEEQNFIEDEEEEEIELKADWMRPFGEHFDVEAGYEGELERSKSRVESVSRGDAGAPFVPDTDIDSDFDLDQLQNSAYLIGEGSYGDWSLQVGARYERADRTFTLRTDDSVQDFDKTYYSLFPSAHLSYKPSDGVTVKAGYSKRVRRPNSWQLDPSGDYDDPTRIRVGNPTLGPEYTHSYEVGGTWIGNKHTLSITPYYRHTTDVITWDERLEDGVTITTFENYETRDSYGLEMVGSLRLGGWLRLNGNFNGYQQKTDGSNLRDDLSSDGFGFMTRVGLQATLREGTQLQLSQFYRSPFDLPNGRISAFTRVDLALRHSLLDGRLDATLRAQDIFDQMAFELRRETPQFLQTRDHNWNARGVSFSLQYTFGQQDNQRRPRPQRGGGDGEEMEGGMM